jgi:metallo-beta-lactamase class B
MKNQQSLYRHIFTLTLCVSLLLLSALAQPAVQKTVQESSVEPFRIAYNLYYVGSSVAGSYLVVTPEGDILINPTDSVEQLQKSIEKLGFSITDVKILLLSNSREELASGSSIFLDLTHAKFMVMEGDVDAVEGRSLKVDRVLHDRDIVQLGGFAMVAYRTAGLTPGCTSWFMQSMSKGELHNVVILGGLQILPGTNLVDRPKHPVTYKGIADDYKQSFKLLRLLDDSIFLSAYSSDFNLTSKKEKLRLGGDESVWVDAGGYKACLAEYQRAFRKTLSFQKKLVQPAKNSVAKVAGTQ